MESNLDKIALDLYGKIQTRFSDIKIGDENATVLSKKEDIPKARFFEFEYEENGAPLGTIAITLDADDGIVVQVSGDLVNDDDDTTHHSAYKFIRSFRQFAKDRLLNFDVQNIGKSNLDKRDYQFQAKRKEEPVMVQPAIMEGAMYGTNRLSYQDLGEARLIIKHNQAVDTNVPGARTMHINSIYIENAQGERFKYPFKHLNGARALAEHVKHGGTPYDAIGKHITSLSEELSSLRKFKGYVSRNESISESMNDITTKVLERIETVKKEIMQLQRPAYYEQFAESFKEKAEQIIPEEVMNDWIDRLTIRTFNEELKSVFPYLYNIVGEDIPIKEVSAEDLLQDDAGVEPFAGKSNEVYDPEAELEEYIEDLVAEDDGDSNALFSPNASAQAAAVDELNKLLSKELKGGPEGVNAIESLQGIIDDPEFIESLTDIDPDLDVRPLIQQFVQSVDPRVAKQLKFGNDEVGGQDMPEPAPAPETTPPAELGAPPVPAEEPVTQEPAPEEPVPAPLAETASAKMKAKFIKAKAAGATLETVMDFGHRAITLRDAIEECGMTPEEVGFEPEESGVEQILKSISGFWNKKERNFTIGGTRAKTKVIKAFKDGEFPNADENDVRKVIAMIEKMDPSTNEHNQIMRLAGVPQNEEMANDPREFDLNALIQQLQAMQRNPDAAGQQVQAKMRQVMEPVAQQVPNQQVNVPGGQINPAQMMQQLLGKLPK